MATGDAGRPADAIVIDWKGGRIFVAGELALAAELIGLRRRPSRSFRLAALIVIARAFGSVTFDELIDAAWGDDIDGGPYQPVNAIRASLCRPRYLALFGRLGISIRSRPHDRRLLIEVAA